MARYSGRRDHMVKTTTDTGEFTQNGDGSPGVEKANVKAWCGETGRTFKSGHGRYTLMPGWTEARDTAFGVCPKCSSKYWAAKLEERNCPFKLGERLDLSGDNRPFGASKYYWKSLYPVIDTRILADADDPRRIVAFIGVESGWGKQWEIRVWAPNSRMRDVEEGAIAEPIIGDVADYTRRWKSGGYDGTPEKIDMTKTDAKRIQSKEQALSMISDMEADGHLRSYQNCIDSDKESLARHKRIQAEKQREREERDAERERMRLEREDKRSAMLLDILEVLNDKALSNFNRDVVFRVAREAGFSEIELSGSAPAPVAAGEPETDEWGIIIE